jgi:tetratricopeptide (TPR) repeat protein
MLNSIGKCYMSGSQYTRAIEYYKSALKIYKKFMTKPANPTIALTQTNLGLCYKQLGEFEHALEHFQKALDTSRKYYMEDLFIKDHPNLCQLCEHMAACHHELMDHKAEFDYRMQVLEMYKRMYRNAPHACVARSLASVGNCHYHMGENDRALSYYFLALDMYQKVYKGREHANLAWLLKQFGRCYTKMGDFKKGTSLWEIFN